MMRSIGGLSYTHRLGERISLYRGVEPILVVAPHAPEETYTRDIALSLAKEFSGFALINNGFKMSHRVNSVKDMADCADLSHIMHPDIKDEFCGHITNTVHTLSRRKETINVFYIYGFPDYVEHMAGTKIDVILGCGAGTDIYDWTCSPKAIQCFTGCYREYRPFGSAICGDVYLATQNREYTGRAANSINQLFNIYYPNKYEIQSVELYLSWRIRKQAMANHMNYTEFLADCLQEFMSLYSISKYNKTSISEI